MIINRPTQLCRSTLRDDPEEFRDNYRDWMTRDRLIDDGLIVPLEDRMERRKANAPCLRLRPEDSEIVKDHVYEGAMDLLHGYEGTYAPEPPPAFWLRARTEAS